MSPLILEGAKKREKNITGRHRVHILINTYIIQNAIIHSYIFQAAVYNIQALKL